MWRSRQLIDAARVTSPDLCPRSGKHGYPTIRAVKAAIKRNKKRGRPLYWYSCPFCDQFHMTKQPQK